MPNRNKQRGDELEREVVNLLRQHGFRTQRTLESGARSDGLSPTWDIDLWVANKDIKIECKRKKSGFKFIYDSVEGSDILVIRQDRCKPLYILSEDLLVPLLKLADSKGMF